MNTSYYTEALYKNRWCEIITINGIVEDDIKKVEKVKILYIDKELLLPISDIKEFR